MVNTNRRNRRRLIPWMIAGTAALAVAPLVASGGVASAAPKAPKASTPVTIGVSEMLTGASEYYGNAALTGVKLGTAYLNAHGGILGHKVVLSIQDDASENSEAVSEVRSFAQNTAIPMVVAPTYQPNFEASCTVASSFGLPIVGAQSAPLSKADNPKNDCFVVTSNVVTQAEAALLTLKKDYGIKTVALLYDQTNAYVSQFDPVIEGLVKKAGLKLVGNLAVTAGQTDYGPQITTLLQANPGVIVPNMVTEDAARFMSQARAEGVKGMFADLISELTNSAYLQAVERGRQGSVRRHSAVGWRPDLRCFHQALHEDLRSADGPDVRRVRVRLHDAHRPGDAKGRHRHEPLRHLEGAARASVGDRIYLLHQRGRWRLFDQQGLLRDLDKLGLHARKALVQN